MTDHENELDRLGRKNAAMRYALDTILTHPNALALPGRPDLASLRGLAYRAISNNAGSDYISKESVKPLVEALRHYTSATRQRSSGIPPHRSWSQDNGVVARAALAHAKSIGIPTETEGA